MGLTDKIKNFIAPIEFEDEELETTQVEAENVSKYEAPKNKTITKSNSNAQMVLFEPRSFEETEEIAKHFKMNKAAVVNLHRLQKDQSRRAIDFLTGVVFALDGSVKGIGHNVLLCSPKSIGVEGEISLNSTDEQY
ncbi:MAG: cell division protein SepF [Erysipelotrichaceae bacterium]